jgi:hypothetical protein
MATKRTWYKVRIQSGEFVIYIHKCGCVANPPGINVWSKKNVRDYIKMLEQLLPWLYG